jgi:phosphatidylserine decarboxylase
MWIQSLYWEIRYGIWITAGMIIGLSTAAVMTWMILWTPDLSPVLTLLIEVVLIVVMATAALLIWFFRDPERFPPETDGVILSPADGKVIYVRELEDESHFVSVKAGTRYPLDELLQDPWPFKGGYLIGIEMNVLDVHVNRTPISGRVVLNKRIKGGFPGLGKPNTEIRSQRAVTIVDDGNILLGVVQIASRFVRGIVSYVKEGQQVQIGQRIGMIRFGSQVDLAIPDQVECQIAVRPGQTVRAGITIMARYGKKALPLSAPADKELAARDVKR